VSESSKRIEEIIADLEAEFGKLKEFSEILSTLKSFATDVTARQDKLEAATGEVLNVAAAVQREFTSQTETLRTDLVGEVEKLNENYLETRRIQLEELEKILERYQSDFKQSVRDEQGHATDKIIVRVDKDLMDVNNNISQLDGKISSASESVSENIQAVDVSLRKGIFINRILLLITLGGLIALGVKLFVLSG
jgi:hypothetical protein